MLPAPISSSSSSSSRHFRPRTRKPSRSSIYPYGFELDGGLRGLARRVRSTLFARSRLTNLGVVLLVCMVVISVLFNLRLRWRLDSDALTFGAAGIPRNGIKSIEDTIERPLEIKALDHLIIVPGHGVWVGSRPDEVWDVGMWVLERYPNQGRGEEEVRERIGVFVEHIRKGVELADEDPNALLIFSGATTRSSTPFSEGTSYLSLALALSLLSPPSDSGTNGNNNNNNNLTTYARTTTEDHALDSFQNLLFSLARFREVTGRYPRRVTVVGYGMKERRFARLHRRAVRWPSDVAMWRYVGVDLSDEGVKEKAMRGERLNGYLPYLRDPYGCHGALLAKRRSRNVHRRAHSYHVSAPEMAGLLEWCPDMDASGGNDAELEEGEVDEALEKRWKGMLFRGRLPWDDL